MSISVSRLEIVSTRIREGHHYGSTRLDYQWKVGLGSSAGEMMAIISERYFTGWQLIP